VAPSSSLAAPIRTDPAEWGAGEISVARGASCANALPPFSYDTTKHLLVNLDACVVAPARKLERRTQTGARASASNESPVKPLLRLALAFHKARYRSAQAGRGNRPLVTAGSRRLAVAGARAIVGGPGQTFRQARPKHPRALHELSKEKSHFFLANSLEGGRHTY